MKTDGFVLLLKLDFLVLNLGLFRIVYLEVDILVFWKSLIFNHSVKFKYRFLEPFLLPTFLLSFIYLYNTTPRK